MISCKDATELAMKSAYRKPGAYDRLRLRFHMLLCKFCKLFQKQNTIIDDAASRLDEFAPKQMTEDSKKRILRIP